MTKIVNHCDAAHFAPHFHATLDAQKGREGSLDVGVGHAAVSRAGRHSQRVTHVELTNQRQGEAGVAELELRPVGPQNQPTAPDVVGRAQAKALHGTMPRCQQATQIRFVAVA